MSNLTTLCLGRKVQETIHIGDSIKIQVIRATSGGTRLAVTAPRDVRIVRGELIQQDQQQSEAA